MGVERRSRHTTPMGLRRHETILHPILAAAHYRKRSTGKKRAVRWKPFTDDGEPLSAPQRMASNVSGGYGHQQSTRNGPTTLTRRNTAQESAVRGTRRLPDALSSADNQMGTSSGLSSERSSWDKDPMDISASDGAVLVSDVFADLMTKIEDMQIDG